MYRQPDPYQNLRRNFTASGIPVTISVIIANVVLLVADTFAHGALTAWIACRLDGLVVFPIWSPLTYPLMSPDFISCVCASFWLWSIGGSLERSWSTQRFGGVALGLSLLTALSLWMGTTLLHQATMLSGLWLPLAALTVAWAAINPRQQVMFWFIQVQAWIIALLVVGFVFFLLYGAQPELGLFALLPSAAAFYYVHSGMSFGRSLKPRGPDLRMVKPRASTLDGSRGGGGPMGWYRDWQERRRLRKLWRDSGFSDQDK